MCGVCEGGGGNGWVGGWMNFFYERFLISIKFRIKNSILYVNIFISI